MSGSGAAADEGEAAWAWRPRPRAVAVSLTVAAALAVAFIVAVGQSSTIYRIQGASVDNAEQVVQQADRLFLRAVGREDASASPGARCYLSRLPPDREIRPVLRCGPVVHFRGSPDRPWDDFSLDTDAAGGGVQLWVSDDITPGRALLPGEILSRPDGKRPVVPDGLTPPPPPRVPPGSVVAVTRPPGAAPAADAGRVSGPGDLKIELQALGSAVEVELRDGPRRAARGEEFLVAELTIRGTAGASLEIVTGSRRVTVPEEARDGRSVLAASVPSGAAALVEIGYRGLVRSLSLRTGEPAGDGVALLEMPLAARPDVNVYRQLVPGAAAGMGSFTLTEVELLAHSEWLGTAPPGQAWVALGLDGFSAPFASGSQAVRLDLAQSFTLVLPDGSVVPAVEMGRPPAGPTVYFAAPVGSRSFVVRVSPIFVVEGGEAAGSLVFGTVEVPVALRSGELGADRDARLR